MCGGPVIFQSVLVGLQQSQSSYNPVREAISSLVYGPYGWLQTASFYVLGLSILALAATLYFQIKRRFRLAGVAGLALVGAAFTVIGANPAAAAGVQATLTSLVHVGATIFVAAGFPIACLLLVPSLRGKRHTALRHYTITVGVSSLLFFTIGGAILVDRMSLVGLFERVLLLNGQLWAVFVCMQLMWDRMRKKSEAKLPVAV